MNQTIEVIVSAQGETEIQTKGFQGETCRHASAYLERALGTTTAERTTAAFHQLPNAQQTEQRHQ